MTVFRFRRAEIAGFFLRSVASIPEMRQKCDRLQAFLGASPIYLGERVARSDKKRSEERKKRALRCHATLWFFRKFADSSNGSEKVEKAVRLTKHIGPFPTGEFLSNISEVA
jgi:hypothetical protein